MATAMPASAITMRCFRLYLSAQTANGDRKRRQYAADDSPSSSPDCVFSVIYHMMAYFTSDEPRDIDWLVGIAWYSFSSLSSSVSPFLLVRAHCNYHFILPSTTCARNKSIGGMRFVWRKPAFFARLSIMAFQHLETAYNRSCGCAASPSCPEIHIFYFCLFIPEQSRISARSSSSLDGSLFRLDRRFFFLGAC